MHIPVFSKIRNKWLSRLQQHRKTVPYPAAKSIGIVYYDPKDKLASAIQSLEKSLGKDNKILTTLRFVRPVSKAREQDFSSKNIGLWGELQGRPKYFINGNFDFLIACHAEPVAAIDTLLLESSAHCRVGPIRDNTFAGLELQVGAATEDLPSMLAEMVRYIQMVK